MDLFSENIKPHIQEIPIEGGYLHLFINFLGREESLSLYKELFNTIDWRQETIKLYGKTYPVPRETAWYGDPGMNYSYSGIKCNPAPWSAALLNLKKKVEEISHVQFNSVLLNKYRNGMDKVGWHSDDEKELGEMPLIASVSLGTTRRFDLRNKNDKTKQLKINLETGSLIIMSGNLQKNWEHQIPQQKRVNEGRINLTFRNIIA